MGWITQRAKSILFAPRLCSESGLATHPGRSRCCRTPNEPVNRAVGAFDTEAAEIVWTDVNELAERKYLFYTGAPEAWE